MDLKHPIRCCIFSFLWVFADFLNYMPNKVKNWKICWKVEFFASFGMKFKKSAKSRKNEKTQHLMGCFKSIKEFKINFLNFFLFLAYFEQKVAKNVFFKIFSKPASFGQNLTLPMCSSWNSLSENVYFSMYFYEFVKKLCYKIKMPKRDV